MIGLNEMAAQSTCPVWGTDTPHKCKCGIKTDGQIYIYCARKQLKRLPKFSRSSILYEELILSGNQIEKITANAFTGLKVKRLYLDENPLSEIEPNAFIELANYLEELVISVSPGSLIGSPRAHLPPNLFQNLLNLKIVKISGLEMGAVIRHSTFNRTRKLEVIHLTECGITGVELNSFAGVEFNLKELNLDNNQLTSAEEIFNEFRRMRRIQSLILSRNRIRALTAFPTTSSHHMTSLAETTSDEFFLDLSFNSLAQIDEQAFGTSLDQSSFNSQLRLNLNNNEITQFQLNFISQLPGLKELHLDYNKIESIPDNLFINSRNLDTLSLKGNLLSHIPSEFAFSGLHFNLKRLSLASNKLQSIGRRVLMQTTKLRELNLERNQLGLFYEEADNQLSNVFEGVEAELKSLNLENNHLAPFHLLSLNNLLNLESLKIGHNQFGTMSLKSVYALDKFKSKETRLAKVFEFYRNLSSIEIQNSSLNQFPYFSGLSRSLLSVNVAQNQICNVNSVNLRSVYSRLKNLNLNQNPLYCDCALNGLKKWLNDNEANLDMGWKCAQPARLKNKFISQINFNDFVCDSEARCNLDEDEIMFRRSQSTTTTTTTTTTSTTTTTITTTTTTMTTTASYSMNSVPNDEIRIVDPFFTTKPISNNRYIAPTVIPPQVEQQVQSPNGSFFTSIELRQTLLGSLIGALSVIIIVCFIICAIKTTRRRFLGKDVSLCGSEKDKSSATTTTTSASTSPYDLTKLSLQTLCINSTGCSSNSSGSTIAPPNSSCVCNLLTNFDQFQPDINGNQSVFTKMDPMRLTMISSASNIQRSSLHQHYLNSCSHHIHPNVHYLASHLPYSPSDSSNGSCPSPGEHSDLNDKSNTYDKLHQQRALNSSASFKMPNHSKSQFNTLITSNPLAYSSHQHVLNKCLHNLNLGDLVCNNRTVIGNSLIPTAETTPFLIMSNENKLINQGQQQQQHQHHLQQQQQQQFFNDHTDYQHTYHEIGDVLLNFNNPGTMKNTSRQEKTLNEMFI